MTHFLRRIWYVVNKRRIEADLAEEIACHRERSGDPRAFGSAALARNQSRDVWIWPWLQDVAQDVRFAVRLLAKDRAVTMVAVGILALGIGVDNTLLIAINAACLRGLPVERADRVRLVAPRDERAADVSASYREFDEFQGAIAAFSGLAAHATVPMSIGEEGRAPDRAIGTYLSADGFRLLGERPILGRDFSAADDRKGAPPVAMLGGGLWASRYGSDPGIIGRSLRVNGVPTTVVGVIRQGFRFPRFTELWQPLHQMPQLAGERRTARTLTLFGRLRDGATDGDARGQIERVAARLAEDHPDTNGHVRFAAVPIDDQYSNKITDPQWLSLLVIGAIVLAIACANVANLLLMRSAQRAQEFAIRASLGASRGRLVRQLLIESTALAALGGVGGAALAVLGARLLTGLVPDSQMPFWIRFTMDGRMLAVLATVTLGTSFVFGLAPAVHVSRTDVAQTLKDGGRSSVGGGHAARWTQVLLIGEFALTVMLITLLVKGERLARAAERRAVGYDATNVVSGSIALPADRYRTADARFAFFQQVEERLGALPAIASFAFAGALPGGGAAAKSLELEGRPAPDGGEAPAVWLLPIGPRYFDAIGVALLRGRRFDTRDGATGAGAAIVNQRLAEMFFAGADPVGRRIRLRDAMAGGAPPPWLTIAGVAPTLGQRPVPEPEPIVYVPLRGSGIGSAFALARGTADTAVVASVLRDVVRAIDPDVPVARVMPMQQAIADAQWAARGSTRISESVVLIAMLLAAAGLYAVTAHAVVLRGPEISLRRALGAPVQHIVWMVWRRAGTPIGVGAAAGVAFAFAWDRLTVSPTGFARMVDPIDLVLVVAVVAAIGIAACLVPIARAVRLDPMAALRRQ